MDNAENDVYALDMSNDTKSFSVPNPLTVQLAALRAQRAELVAAIKDYDKAIDEIERLLAVPSSQEMTHHVVSEAKSSFLSLSISQAAIQVLKDTGQPMTSRKIADVFKARGFETYKEDTRHAIQSQLIKRNKSQGDVIRQTGGRWALKEWYDDRELQDIAKSLNRTPGRDAELHSQRTREAMQASRERGVQIGRKPFEELYPEEVLAKCRKLRAEGLSMFKIAETVGMPYQTYRKWHDWIHGLTTDKPGNDWNKKSSKIN